MPNKPEKIYEYAVVRYVPRVEREEFINVGLVMMCKRSRWIRVAIRLNEDRIMPFRPAHSCKEISAALDAFVALAEGRKDTGELGTLPVEERFRWLTAVRSACIQTSRPHPGLTDDLDATFERLLQEQVL